MRDGQTARILMTNVYDLSNGAILNDVSDPDFKSTSLFDIE